MSFINKKNLGSFAEKAVIDLLEKSGIQCRINPEKKNKQAMIIWDIEFLLTTQRFYIEVKHDYMSKKTGNIAIEFWNSRQNKPSGITATRAELWVVMLEDSIWITSVNQLKKYCEENKPLKTIISGGDNNSNMYIYKRDEIISIFNRVDDLDSKDFVKLLEQLVRI